MSVATSSRVWNGTALAAVVKAQVWDGSTFVHRPLRVWDGSGFVLLYPTSIPAPATFTAAQNAASPEDTVDLAITPPADLVADSLRIERALDVAGSPGTWSEVLNVSPDTVAIEMSGLADGTKYWFRPRYAIDREPLMGSYGPERSVTTQLAAPAAAPAWAVGFPRDKAGVEGPAELQLQTVADAAAYEIYYRVGASMAGDPLNTGTLLGSYTEAQIVSAILEHATGQTHGTVVYYQPRATNAGGSSPWGTEQSVTIQAPAVVAPLACTISNPSGLTVRIDITPASPDYADQYRYEILERPVNTSGGSWSPVTGSPTTATHLEFTGLSGYEYTARVRAENNGGSSTYTQSSTLDLYEAPTIAFGAGDPVSNETTSGFDVAYTTGGYVETVQLRYRQNGTSHAWTTVSDGDTTSPISATGVADDTTWEIELRATNTHGGDSGWVTTVYTATTLSLTPAQITGLTVVPDPTTDHLMDLSWSPDSVALEYEVYCSLSSMAGDPVANGTKVASNPPDATLQNLDVASLLGAGADDQVFVQVRGKNGANLGAFSSEVSGRTNRDAPGISSVTESYVSCPTSFSITVSVNHENSNGNARNKSGTVLTSTDGTNFTQRATFAGTVTSVSISPASTSWTHVRAKYDDESAVTTSGVTLTGCPS